jgi:hypothetical protein
LAVKGSKTKFNQKIIDTKNQGFVSATAHSGKQLKLVDKISQVKSQKAASGRAMCISMLRLKSRTREPVNMFLL